MIKKILDIEIKHKAAMVRVILNQAMKINGLDYEPGELVDIDKEKAEWLINIGKADRYRMPREGK